MTSSLAEAFVLPPSRFEDYDRVPLEAVVAESTEIIDKSLASTERILDVLGQAEQIGSQTCANLYEQGRKIDSFEAQTAQINDHLDQGARERRGIRSIAGAIRNLFTPRPSPRDPKSTRPRVESPAASSSSPAASSSSESYGTRAMLARGDFDHLSEESQQGLHKIEDNLDAISKKLDTLAGMSQAMSVELKEQNRQLEQVGPVIERTAMRTGKAARKTRRLWE